MSVRAVGDAWIIDVVRTPRGKGRPDGGLPGEYAQALFGSCLVALAAGTGSDPVEVDDVIAGNGVLAGETRDLQAGLVTMCTGGGMGTATIVERV